VLEDLVGILVVLIFNDVRVPFYCQMTLLKEIINELISGRQDAATAHVYPVALGALKALPFNRLEHKRLEHLFFSLKKLFPVLLLPP